jgi:hypothetical protein
MTAEEVPLDPRVTLEVSHRTENRTARKTRLVCGHPSQSSTTSQGTVYGDEWIEMSPKWPHFDRQYRQMENDESRGILT